MAPILLLGRRAWPRAARAAIAAAMTLGIAAVPSTEAQDTHALHPTVVPPSHEGQHSQIEQHSQGQPHGTAEQPTQEKPKHPAPHKPPHHKPPRDEPSHHAPQHHNPPKPGKPTAVPSTATKPPSSPAAPTQPTAPVKTRPISTIRVPSRRPARPRNEPRRTSAPTSGGGVADTSAGGAAPTTTAATAPSTNSSTADAANPRVAPRSAKNATDNDGSTVTRTVRDIVKVVPSSVKAILAALGALTVLLGAGSLFSTLRARRLDHQRQELLQEVGLLQSALLPPVPPTVGALKTSVAYRPADGSAAGGDFYDALSLPDGKAVFILGDVSGHGRAALERTAFLRYTLRAYLEAGLAPRVALQVAGKVIDEHLGGDFATVLLAVHDPATGSLTYASAGHPAPIVVGPSAYEPVLVASSPPVGVGLRTGLRQTTVPLAPGSVACLHTDGLTEARTEEGILGRGALTDLVEELGRDVEAPKLLARVAEESRSAPDDMAVCVLSPTAGVTAGGFRTELLELSAEELEGPLGARFLEACGVTGDEAQHALDDAGWLATRFDRVVLHVVFGNRLSVEAVPANVESIEAAARRSLAV